MELSTAQSKSWMRRKTLKVNSGEARARSPCCTVLFARETRQFTFRNQNVYVYEIKQRSFNLEYAMFRALTNTDKFVTLSVASYLRKSAHDRINTVQIFFSFFFFLELAKVKQRRLYVDTSKTQLSQSLQMLNKQNTLVHFSVYLLYCEQQT